MDRRTVFTKTAKGLMEATGKTSVLSRDMRALLKEIDGKATLREVHIRLGKVPEAALQLSRDDGCSNSQKMTTTADGAFAFALSGPAMNLPNWRWMRTTLAPRRFMSRKALSTFGHSASQ